MNKKDREHISRVASLGCIVCLNAGHPDVPAAVHHCGTGRGGRKDHQNVIPLCHYHHQGEGGIHTIGRRKWQEIHGTEAELERLVRVMLYGFENAKENEDVAFCSDIARNLRNTNNQQPKKGKTMKTEKPILLQADMIRAVLSGRKTQTRRIIKPRFIDNDDMVFGSGALLQETISRSVREWRLQDGVWFGLCEYNQVAHTSCPYGLDGGTLWVREAFGFANSDVGSEYPIYKASCLEADNHKWHPSIHMPRKISRITFSNISISVERLKDITEEDACAEGVDVYDGGTYRDYLIKEEENDGYNYFRSPRDSFLSLWSSINGQDSVDANPWVWVIKFTPEIKK